MVISAHRRLRAIPQYRIFRPPPTVFISPQSASQTCPRCGDRLRNNRESQAETPFLNVNLAGWATRSNRLHPDLPAATISAQSTNGRPHTGSISQAQPDSRIDEP